MQDEISGPPVRGEAGIAGIVPFGLGSSKPRHFREALGAAWENRDSLGYAWRILDQGVCDGCSLGPRGLRDDVLPGIHLCTKRLRELRDHTIGAFTPSDVANIERLRHMTESELRALGRVPFPFVFRPGDRGFSRLSWTEALDLAGTVLRETSPERTAWFSTGTSVTNETWYVLAKTARLMGTNNVDGASRLGHAASAAGLTETLGFAGTTCSLGDWLETDLLLLWGANLAENQPVTAKYLAAAKQRGARVVVINPMYDHGLEANWIPTSAKSAVLGSRLMDDFVPVRAGGDLALMHAVLKTLLRWDAVDHSFIANHTTGWEAFSADLQAQSLRTLADTAGVTMSQVEWLAQLIARSRNMVSVWSAGLTHHGFGTENVMGVAHLHLSQGAIGKPGSGLVPVGGHAGVEGQSECGIGPDRFPGRNLITPENAAKLEKQWGHAVPPEPGLAAPAMLDAAHAGELDMLYDLGGALQAALPDPSYTAAAFRRIRLRVVHATHLGTSALLEPGEAVLLLPAQSRYEQRGGGTSTSIERRIRFTPEISGHPTLGESRPDYEIPALVACAARPELEASLLFRSSQAIRAEMGEVVPIYAGIENLQKEGDWIQWGGPHLGASGKFPNLPEQKARFSVLVPPSTKLEVGEFVLTSRQMAPPSPLNEVDAQERGSARDVQMSASDAADLGVKTGSRVRLHNEQGEMIAVVRLGDIREGHLQGYWSEANILVPRVYDPQSGAPSHTARVRVEPL